jgi:hypothetical protein
MICVLFNINLIGGAICGAGTAFPMEHLRLPLVFGGIRIAQSVVFGGIRIAQSVVFGGIRIAQSVVFGGIRIAQSFVFCVVCCG